MVRRRRQYASCNLRPSEYVGDQLLVFARHAAPSRRRSLISSISAAFSSRRRQPQDRAAPRFKSSARCVLVSPQSHLHSHRDSGSAFSAVNRPNRSPAKFSLCRPHFAIMPLFPILAQKTNSFELRGFVYAPRLRSVAPVPQRKCPLLPPDRCHGPPIALQPGLLRCPARFYLIAALALGFRFRG